jgi:tRNA 2-thiouridine synthesizing protein A
MTPDREVDARGLKCPLPVLRAAKALREMRPGEVLLVLADDPMAAIDLPHHCAEVGHHHLGRTDEASHQAHLIRRG